jgi:protein disulfide-isomerase A1
MNKVALGLLFMCVLGALAEVKEEEDVLVLTDDNFDEVIKENEFILVEFYAPWCGHCKKLAPEYSKAAGQLKKDNIKARLAKVDSTVEKKVAERFDVRGYPTLKFFTNGSPIEYGGGRTAQEIVDWLKKKLLPPSQEVKTSDEAEKLISDNEVVVIYFGETGTEEHNSFVTVARGFDDITFAHTSDGSIAGKYQVEDISSPKVVLFKKFDEGRNDFTGEIQIDALKTFVDSHQYPDILPFTQKAAQRIFGDGHPALFLFHEGDDAGNRAQQALKEASAALKGKIILSVSGVREGLPKRLADYVGVAEKDIPTVRIVDPGHDELQKFTLESDISADTIIQFYEDWANKRLSPVYKSQEIPESNDEPVKVRNPHHHVT